MSFQTWLRQSDMPVGFAKFAEAGWSACEAEMRSPGPCGVEGHQIFEKNISEEISGEQWICTICTEITALKAENIRLDAEWKQAHQTNSNLLTERFQLKADLTRAIRLAADYGIDRDRLGEFVGELLIDNQPLTPAEIARGKEIAKEFGLLSAPASGQPDDMCPECGNCVFHEATCSRASGQKRKPA